MGGNGPPQSTSERYPLRQAVNCFQYLFFISSLSNRATLPLMSFTITIYFEKFQTHNKNKRILQQKHSDLDSTDILLFFLKIFIINPFYPSTHSSNPIFKENCHNP